MQLNQPFAFRNGGYFRRRFLRTAYVTAAMLVVVFLSNATAEASLVTSVFSWFSGGQASAELAAATNTPNLQTIDLLQAASNINPNPENRAEVAPIDGSVLVPDIAATNDSSSTELLNTQISTYTVRDGDTISSVAKMFNVSVNTVRWSNDLNGRSTLKAGQDLIILPISGITYTIKKSDTIQSIAKKYGADISDILNYNDLTLSSKLDVGTTLIIPDAELSSAEITAAQPQRPAPSKGPIKNAPFEPLLDPVWNWPTCNGCFIRPVDGGYVSQKLHGHNAIDIASPVGTPIHAMADGTVIISRTGGWNGGYGTFVVLSHNVGGMSTQTLYAHMSRTAVTAGQHVYQGQTIGYIGLTGLTTGPHVHFEIRGAKNPF